MFRTRAILGDLEADSRGEGKSKRAEKYGTKKSKNAIFFRSPSLSAPWSPGIHSGGLVALGTKVKGSGEKTTIKQKKQWTLTRAWISSDYFESLLLPK